MPIFLGEKEGSLKMLWSNQPLPSASVCEWSHMVAPVQCSINSGHAFVVYTGAHIVHAIVWTNIKDAPLHFWGVGSFVREGFFFHRLTRAGFFFRDLRVGDFFS